MGWGSSIGNIRRSSPEDLNDCADAGYRRFTESFVEHLPESADKKLIRTRIEEHSFQFLLVSLINYGRGSARDVTLAMPVPFELTDGPQGPFDLEEGGIVSWRMETPKGEVDHPPAVRIDFDSGHDPDLILYIFYLVLAWGLIVGPALVAEFLKSGAEAEDEPGAGTAISGRRR